MLLTQPAKAAVLPTFYTPIVIRHLCWRTCGINRQDNPRQTLKRPTCVNIGSNRLHPGRKTFDDHEQSGLSTGPIESSFELLGDEA